MTMFSITKTNGTTVMAQFNASAAVKLHWNGSNTGLRLETTQTGVKTYGNLESTGDVIAFSASDMTLKKDISPIQNALDMINKLSGNTFTWKPIYSPYFHMKMVLRIQEFLHKKLKHLDYWCYNYKR